MKCRPPGLLLALVALVPVSALLAGCTSGNAGLRYVSLGDSYTAAPGVGSYVDPTGCFRSKDNYPNLLADKRGFHLVDVSCGSAQTGNGETPQKTSAGKTVEPQLDVLDDGTDVVTVGLGANDGGLIPRIIFQCPAHLAAEPDQDSATPCTDQDKALDDGFSSVDVLAGLSDQLVTLFDEIQDEAPNATVVAVGYPQIFPETDGCDLLPIPAGDVPWAAGIVRDLNKVMEAAADEAGIAFLDMQSVTRDHHMCADDPWIAGSETIPERGAAFHPFPEEQELVAERLDQLLDTLLPDDSGSTDSAADDN